MMAPAFTQAAQNFSTRAVLAKLNTENEARLGQQFNIRSIPTLVVFKQGREAARQSGALDLANLTQFIERQL
jgi:thioredoxin 2